MLYFDRSVGPSNSKLWRRRVVAKAYTSNWRWHQVQEPHTAYVHRHSPHTWERSKGKGRDKATPLSTSRRLRIKNIAVQVLAHFAWVVTYGHRTFTCQPPFLLYPAKYPVKEMKATIRSAHNSIVKLIPRSPFMPWLL